MAKFEAVVAFKTKDMEAISKIRERFGMPQKMTVNWMCPVRLDDDDEIEMSKKCEEIGFLDIRYIESFEFPKV